MVIDPNEIYLASYDSETGDVLREGRFKLEANTYILPQLTGLYPPVVAINDDGKSVQPLVSSSFTYDTTAGLGIKYEDRGGNPGRFYFAHANTRHVRGVVQPPKKVDMGNPAGTQAPTYGCTFEDKVWIAFDDDVYYYTEALGWSALQHSFAAGAVPTAPPVVWGEYMYWFVGTGIEYYNSTTGWAVNAQDAQSGVLIGDVLYIVSPDGDVKSHTDHTFVAAWTDEASVGQVPNGMIAYINPDGAVVPYVIGETTMYIIDPANNLAANAGPPFAPSPYPLRATVLSADNRMYIAKGSTVVAWDGDTAESVGLDVDHGLPLEYRGGVVEIINGNLELYALYDGSAVAVVSEESDVYSGDPYRDVAGTAESNSMLFLRTERGWHTEAMSTDAAGDPTATTSNSLLFISDSESTFRLWFAWGNDVYTIDLPTSFFNPADDPQGRYEPKGFIDYAEKDFGFDADKIGLAVEVRVDIAYRNSGTDYAIVKPYIKYDGSETWYELHNSDGTHGIDETGRHRFLLHASPIPTDLSPLEFGDEPAVGRSFDSIQVRCVLERGSATADTVTPRLVWVGVYALRALMPTMGWTVNLDMSKEYKGLTPQQQFDLAHRLMHDNVRGLLHMAYVTVVADSPVLNNYAVKMTGFQAKQTSGQSHSRKSTVRLTMTEVINAL